MSLSLFEPIVCVMPSTIWFTSVSVLLPMSGIANGSYPSSCEMLWRKNQFIVALWV